MLKCKNTYMQVIQKAEQLLLFCRFEDKMVLPPTNWFERVRPKFIRMRVVAGYKRKWKRRSMEFGNEEYKNVIWSPGSFSFVTKMCYIS